MNHSIAEITIVWYAKPIKISPLLSMNEIWNSLFSLVCF